MWETRYGTDIFNGDIDKNLLVDRAVLKYWDDHPRHFYVDGSAENKSPAPLPSHTYLRDLTPLPTIS